MSSADLANAIVGFLRESKRDLPAVRYLYIDYSEVDKLRINMGDVMRFVEVAKIIASENSSLIVAICAPQFDNYCITKMWEVHLPDDFGWITHVFRDQGEAKAWVNKTVQENLSFS